MLIRYAMILDSSSVMGAFYADNCVFIPANRRLSKCLLLCSHLKYLIGNCQIWSSAGKWNFSLHINPCWCPDGGDHYLIDCILGARKIRKKVYSVPERRQAVFLHTWRSIILVYYSTLLSIADAPCVDLPVRTYFSVQGNQLFLSPCYDKISLHGATFLSHSSMVFFVCLYP